MFKKAGKEYRRVKTVSENFMQELFLAIEEEEQEPTSEELQQEKDVRKAKKLAQLYSMCYTYN